MEGFYCSRKDANFSKLKAGCDSDLLKGKKNCLIKKSELFKIF